MDTRIGVHFTPTQANISSDETLWNEWFPKNLREVCSYDDDNMSLNSVVHLPQKQYDADEKRMILKYLNSDSHYRVDVPTIHNDIDAFTGIVIKKSAHDLSCDINHDGMWTWRRTLYYYIENYNIAVPEDFIMHIKAST